LIWQIVVSHQCIRLRFGAFCSEPSWISARRRSHYRLGLGGHLGHQFSPAPGRPFSPFHHSLSQTSAGSCWVYCCQVIAMFLCSIRRTFLRPDLVASRARRAQALSGLAVTLRSPLGKTLPGHILTRSSTMRSSNRLGCHFWFPYHFEVAVLGQHRPGDACKFVGKCNRQHIVMQALPGRINPRL